MIQGQRVKILKDGRESGYFNGKVGIVTLVLDGMAIVEVTLRSGRIEKWIGEVTNIQEV